MPDSSRPAGLAARVSAAVVDAASVLFLAFCVVGLGRAADTYIPLELTFLLAWVSHAVIAAAWRKRTLGKWVLGLTVQSRDGGRPGALRAVWRETRVMHDPAVDRRRWAVGMTALGTAIVLGPPLVTRAGLYVRAAQMTPHAPTAMVPAAAAPRDVNTVSPADHPALVRWLDEHGRPPDEYTVEVTARHQLTIVGEFHHVGGNLRFLTHLIPDLYHKAGITCLAMEALVWDDNAALERLVTAAQFDREQAVALARHEGWKSWGSREYWDVLEAVWQLNHALPAGQPRLRVIGLDREWDMPSWSLVGMGDDARPGAWWERLRLVRVLPDLPLMAKRDELMAWQLEQEVFAKGRRAVAWVGAAHAYTDYATPGVPGVPGSARHYRMGAILRQRHGESVCHLRLHDSAFEGPALAALIETIQAARGHAPVGFHLAGSPLADLRDEGGLAYRRDPRARFADFAGGYLYLGPLRDQRHCEWEEGFITRAMFLRDKPYYEVQADQLLRNASEANDAFRRQWEK